MKKAKSLHVNFQSNCILPWKQSANAEFYMFH